MPDYSDIITTDILLKAANEGKTVEAATKTLGKVGIVGTDTPGQLTRLARFLDENGVLYNKNVGRLLWLIGSVNEAEKILLKNVD